MRMNVKQRVIRISSLLVLAVLCLAMLTSSRAAAPLAYAAESANAFDNTYVLDDLEGATIDGKLFSISDYAPDPSKETTVLLFVEYCYSPYSNLQENFALYAYVWNPQQLFYNVRSTRNGISLSYVDDTTTAKYPITFLSVSTGGGQERLFYKFKVILSAKQRADMLAALDSESRIYHVAGIELVTSDDEDIHDYKVNSVYTYSGFAEGYGGESEQPLNFTKQDGEVYVIDDGIKQTFYSPEESNGKTSYTQDSLQSVYFSVPNTILEQYGLLSAVKMEWLKAQTSWGLVTGTEKFYNAFLSVVGLSPYSSTPSYPSNTLPFIEYGLKTASYDPNAQFTYNFKLDNYIQIPHLAYVFAPPSFGMDTADDYTVPWETFYAWMQAYYDTYDISRLYDTTPADGGQDGWLYAKYNFTSYKHDYLEVDGVTYPFSEALFSYWENEKTVMDIYATENRSLTSVDIDYSWWDWITGGDGTVVSSDRFDGIEAIKLVGEDDFKATEEQTCDSLYINISDYADFKTYYDEATQLGETVVLIRYDVGEYNALEIAQGTPYDGTLVEGLLDYDTNARIFNMSVYLDLDIITLTFGNGETSVTIPVVADPIDAGRDSTPAINTTSDAAPWWCYLLIVLFELIIFLLLGFLLKKVFRLPDKVFYIVWFLIFAIAIVLNILFIGTWAQALYQWLRSWLPFV